MAIWNQIVPDALRGRLASIEMVSYTSGPALGNAESGLVAGLFSVPVSVVSGGVLCVLGCVACARSAARRSAPIDAEHVKVAVVGAGGVGSVFGGRLAAAGHEVWLVHRRREVVDGAAAATACTSRASNGDLEHIPLHATDSTAEVGEVDLVLILTKSIDTRCGGGGGAVHAGRRYASR